MSYGDDHNLRPSRVARKEREETGGLDARGPLKGLICDIIDEDRPQTVSFMVQTTGPW